MENTKKFNCELCNYTTIKPSDWIKHINSAKHQRGGVRKTKNCEICNKDFFSHWSLKHHILVTHQTKEERMKQKYYCSDCDQVFFCKLYRDKHMIGIKHMNIIKANKLVEEMNNLNNKI